MFCNSTKVAHTLLFNLCVFWWLLYALSHGCYHWSHDFLGFSVSTMYSNPENHVTNGSNHAKVHIAIIKIRTDCLNSWFYHVMVATIGHMIFWVFLSRPCIRTLVPNKTTEGCTRVLVPEVIQTEVTYSQASTRYPYSCSGFARVVACI
jgi:hypothetical protein